MMAGGSVAVAADTAGQDDASAQELEAQFEQGMAALKDSRLKSAIRAFSKILDIDPKLDRARLELALAYYRSLRYDKAQELAQKVLDNPTTPPEVRVTVLAFLAQVKRDAEQLGKRNNFSGFISAGTMHDSNVNVGPTEANIRVGDIPLQLAPGSLKKSDSAYVLNAGIDHLYQSRKRIEVGERTGLLLWQSGASIYSRQYNHQDDYDLVIASLNTGPALLMLRHWRASLQFKSDYFTLGDRALAWFNGINPSITWQFRNGELNWDFDYTRRFYHRQIDNGREGDYLSTGLTLGHYFNNRRVSATAGGRLIKFFAEDSYLAYDGFEATAGVSTDTYRNGSAYVRQRVAYYNYDGDDPVVGKERDDTEYRTTVGLSHEYNEPEDLLKDWVVNVFYEFTKNDSNIGKLYSYERNQWMLTLSRGF